MNLLQKAVKLDLQKRLGFVLPDRWIVEQLLGGLILAQLEQMFCYRHEVIQRQCSSSSSKRP